MPKPDAETWKRFSLIARDDEGAIVEAEFIRPDWWLEKNGIVAGSLMPLAIEELKLSGMATIQSVEECGPIAHEGGSVVTGRFTTSRVDVIVRLTVAAADGTTEVLEGTTVHPVWSVDRHDWVQLSELQPGEILQAADGDATVVSIAIVSTTVPVYNIEVHGEHVYQIGQFAILVHNQCHHIVSHIANINRGWTRAWSQMGQNILQNAGIGIHSLKNKVNLVIHQGPHAELYHQRVFQRLDQAVQGLVARTPQYTAAVEAELQAIANILRSNPSALGGIGL